MNHYITHSLTFWKPKNEKTDAMQELAKRYENIIIYDQLSLDALKMEIRAEMEALDKKYPRTKAMRFYCREYNSWKMRIEVAVPGANSDLDNNVFFLTIDKAKGIYRFSENIQDNLSTQTTKAVLLATAKDMAEL